MVYASTLNDLTEDRTMGTILDRSQNVTPVYQQMKQRWNRELFERNPTPAYNKKGEYVGTNLDMASVLNTLTEREAVINFPDYKPKGTEKRNDKEWIVSKENRHGKIKGLIAKKDAFSFSVRFEDQNVVDLEENKTGKCRNFLITDLNGDFYQGSKTIEVPAYADIVDFIDEYKIATKDCDKNGSRVVSFRNFVQPNLWQAFYSGDFFKTKTLEKRLVEESKYYRNVTNRIKERLVEDDEVKKFYYEIPVFGERIKTVPKKIKTLQVDVDVPELEGRYPAVKPTMKGLAEATRKANEISYSILPCLRFNTRAVELAFFKHGKNGKLNPGWSVPEVEKGYKLEGKRTEWNRIAIDDDLALRYRIWERTERVSPASL